MTVATRWLRSSRALVAWSLALAPVVWLVLVGAFVVRARVVLGGWPAPYRPDPKDLGFWLHHSAIVAGIPTMFVAVACAVVLSVRARRWACSAAALLGLGAVIVIGRVDPGYVFTWLAD